MTDLCQKDEAGQGGILALIRQQHPVVHAITNPVTMHDVVNMILASGASAICADAPEETAEITGLCDALLINTGMPEQWKLQAMLRAGARANERGIPVVLDPVGAGASSFRKEFLRQLLDAVHFDCIRCNMSEAAALCGIAFRSRGVEDAGVRLDTEQMQALAAEYQTVLAITGETDYTVTKEQIFKSQTGTALEKSITGAGCMLSGLMAAAISAGRTSSHEKAVHGILAGEENAPDKILPAVPLGDYETEDGRTIRLRQDAGAVRDLLAAYGQQATAAEARMRSEGHVGTATFRSYFMDAVSLASGLH